MRLSVSTHEFTPSQAALIATVERTRSPGKITPLWTCAFQASPGLPTMNTLLDLDNLARFTKPNPQSRLESYVARTNSLFSIGLRRSRGSA